MTQKSKKTQFLNILYRLKNRWGAFSSVHISTYVHIADSTSDH